MPRLAVCFAIKASRALQHSDLGKFVRDHMLECQHSEFGPWQVAHVLMEQHELSCIGIGLSLHLQCCQQCFKVAWQWLAANDNVGGTWLGLLAIPNTSDECLFGSLVETVAWSSFNSPELAMLLKKAAKWVMHGAV